jgi:hypothetical protein
MDSNIVDSALDPSNPDRIMAFTGSASVIVDGKDISVNATGYDPNFQNSGFTHNNGPTIIFS